MTLTLKRLVDHCDELLGNDTVEDYCPNGLQVDAGTTSVHSIVTGVTASQALIEAAVAARADLLLVHHGYFWKGEAAPLTGIKGMRIRTLMQNRLSLLAYHLPLDMHPQLGNNRQLGERLGLIESAPLDGKGLVWQGRPASELSAPDLSRLLQERLSREPLHLSGGDHPIRRIGWCTGAAQGYIEQAAAQGCDAFISGEVSEQTLHLARELSIHYYAAGHHATERYGVEALGTYLADRFGVGHRFIDIPNPV